MIAKQPTQEATSTFVDAKTPKFGTKQPWNFIDDSKQWWAVFEKDLAEAMQGEAASNPSIKVKYYEKQNGKYTNRIITNAYIGGKWLVEEKDAPGASSAPNQAVKTDLPEHTALEAASRIVAAHIAKSDQAGNLSLHGAATINLAATLLTFFGSKKESDQEIEEKPFA